jgi:DNA-binding transcriptional MocR family regulator
MDKILQGFLTGDKPSPSSKRQANKLLCSRLTLTHGYGYYEVHTWLDKDGGLKVEIADYCGRTRNATIFEGDLEDKLNES